MTGNDQAEAIVGAERSGSTLGTRVACKAGEIAVRNDFSVRDGTQRAQDGELERRPAPDFQVDVIERGTLAGEVRLDPLDDVFRF